MRVVPILDPHNLPLEDLRGDTASGCIVYNHPEKQHYLLFHGEKPPKKGYRQLREIWVAPIHKDLTVDLESAKKIVPQTNEHLSAVRGVFNVARREYIVTFARGKTGYVHYYDEEWNLKACKQVYSESGDHGFPIAPLGCYGRQHQAITTIPAGPSNMFAKVGYFDNIDSPENVKLMLDEGYAFQHGSGNDVCDLTLIPRMALFYESDEYSQWHLKIALGPPTTELPGKPAEPGLEFKIGFLVGSLQAVIPVHSQYIQTGHPHYTVYPDGEPKLLIAPMTDTWSSRPNTGIEGYTHALHAVYLEETNIFDPRTYGSLSDKIISPERGSVSKWYYTSESKTLVLIVTNVPENGSKIVMDEAGTYEDAFEQSYVSTKFDVKSPCKLVVSAPAPVVRFRTQNEGLKITMTAKY